MQLESSIFATCDGRKLNFQMNLIYRYVVVALAIVMGCACSTDDIYDGWDNGQSVIDPVEEGTTELRFGVSSTRATLDENLDLRWQRGDRITLMAWDGAEQIFSKEASFWANLTDKTSVGSQGYFKAKFDTTEEADALTAIEQMVDGKCYAVSPARSVTIEGTTAKMTIPSVQSGEYGGAPDFMTARSSSISGLKLCVGGTTGAEYDPNDSKYINDIDLVFKHHTHAFRVTIPHNNLGTEVVRAYVKFPFAVVGEVSVDYTTGEVVSVNNTSDLIVVEFAEPKSSGDEFWVFINGVENKGGVDIRFQTADGTYTERRVAAFTQKNWTAGAISKVKLSVPVATTITEIACNVADHSRLGEPVTDLHFALAQGYYFADYTTSCSMAVNADEGYATAKTFKIFSDLIDSGFRSAEHALTFESESAIVANPDPIIFGESINAGKLNTYDLSAPYLFEENFSRVSAFEYELSKKTGAVTAKALDEYGLAGWYGARVGVNSGAVAIGVRHETVAEYRGRLDTSGLSALKDGKTVNIQLKFNANRSNDYAFLNCGIALASEGALAGGDDISGESVRIDPATNSSISYTNISSTDIVCNFSGVNNANRISWRVSRDYDFVGNGWESKSWRIYMDNIRVTIVK